VKVLIFETRFSFLEPYEIAPPATLLRKNSAQKKVHRGFPGKAALIFKKK